MKRARNINLTIQIKKRHDWINPFTPELPVQIHVLFPGSFLPLVTSSVLTVQGNFVR